MAAANLPAAFTPGAPPLRHTAPVARTFAAALGAVTLLVALAALLGHTARGDGPAAPAAAGGEDPAAASAAGAPGDAGATTGDEPPALATCGLPHDPGDFVRAIARPEGDRAYRLHVPAGYGDTPRALVLNFHGYARTAAEQEEYSGLVPLSDREGFVLVTPEGSGSPQGWDIPGIYADIGVDDTAFAAALIDDVAASLCIDPARIFATGMSNGGQMAALLGCAYPGLIAAVAPVAGLAVDACAHPVPLITFEGSDDWNVEPWLVEETFALWGPANGCDPTPREELVTESVLHRWFEGCAGNDAGLYFVLGGGHTWPGAPPGASSGAGATTAEINASELIWAFFAAHPLP